MTRFLNGDGRALVRKGGVLFDLQRASGGRFGADPAAAFGRWRELGAWIDDVDERGLDVAPEPAVLGSPTPQPRQILAVGINFAAKLAASGRRNPTDVGVIAKLFNALAGPHDDIAIDSAVVYVEAEIAVVIGEDTEDVALEDALGRVAGLTLALDLADVEAFVEIEAADATAAPARYYNPAKSQRGFAPLGPELVTLDELGSLDDVPFQLELNGTTVQQGTTRDAVFSIAEIITRLSRRIHLFPGDVILAGSPGQLPGRPLAPLQAGDTIVASSPLLGVQRHTVVARDRRSRPTAPISTPITAH